MNSEKDTQSYDDIINLPHLTSVNHPRMSLYDRAAQFSPFAALTGHEDAIKEMARLTEQETELDEDEMVKLNEKLHTIKERAGDDAEVTITCFVPDEKKSGGAYISYTGSVKKIDVYAHTVVMADNTVIPIGQIREIVME